MLHLEESTEACMFLHGTDWAWDCMQQRGGVVRRTKLLRLKFPVLNPKLHGPHDTCTEHILVLSLNFKALGLT